MSAALPYWYEIHVGDQLIADQSGRCPFIVLEPVEHKVDPAGKPGRFRITVSDFVLHEAEAPNGCVVRIAIRRGEKPSA